MLCVPIIGNMTAYYIGNDDTAVQDYLLYHLEVEMNEQRVRSGSIKETFFIGSRPRPGPPDPPVKVTGPSASKGDVSLSSNDSGSILPIVLAVSLGALFFIVVALFTLARRRRNREDESLELSPTSSKGLDMDLAMAASQERNWPPPP